MGKPGAALGAGFSLGLIVGWLLGSTCDAREKLPLPSSANTPLQASPEPREPRPREKRVRQVVATSGQAASSLKVHGPSVPPVGGVREVPVPGAASALSFVDVEVLDALGSPAEWAVVYALRAGARGPEGPTCIPVAETDEHARCRLVLPSPAAYDIAAIGANTLAARALDVRVPGARWITLRLDSPRRTTFVLDPERPPEGVVEFEITDSSAGDRHSYPGRDQAPAWAPMRHRLEPGARPLDIDLPARLLEVRLVPTRGSAETQRVEFEPNTFTPPGTVVVRRASSDPRSLEVDLRFLRPRAAVRTTVLIDYRLEVPGVPAIEGSARLSRRSHVPERVRVPVRVEHRRGTVRVSGSRLEPSLALWDLDASPVVELTATVVEKPTIRLRVDVTPRDEDDDHAALVYPDPADATEVEHLTVPLGVEIPLEVAGPWLMVDLADGDRPGSGRVAGPRRFDAGDAVVMRPVLGGCVVFSPDTMPPNGAGLVTLARADGAPFRIQSGGSERYGLTADVRPGDVVGPFEPGLVTLDVHVGGILWGRYEVNVRAGEFTAFMPRPFRR